jgi:adenine/guanine/hypoxanthine permease
MAHATRERAQPSTMEQWFALSKRGTDVGTEVRAGLTTFMVMGYIVVVNPIILTAGAAISRQDVPFGAVVTSTCLAAALMTLAMGLWANLPFAMAPGLGINAVVAFQLMGTLGYTFSEAMGVIVLEGLIITVLVLTGLRQQVLHALPVALKLAIGGGIGLFIFSIGAYEAGVYRVPLAATQGGTVAPPTAGALGSFTTPAVLYAVAGLVLTIALMRARVKGAILIAILATTVVGLVLQAALSVPMSAQPGKLALPASILSAPDLRLIGSGIAGLGFLTRGGADLILAGVLATVSLMLSDFFDTAGTFTGLGKEAGLVDANGNLVENEDRAYLVDSLGALMGGAVGSSSATTYIESAAGIAEGGRTGLTAVVAAIPFVVAMVLGSLIAIVPQEATAGALMVVGVLMLAAVGTEIPWRDFSVAVPALFTLMLMPLTWSITNGIAAGVVLYVLLHGRRAGLLMWVLAAVFVLYLAFGTK